VSERESLPATRSGEAASMALGGTDAAKRRRGWAGRIGEAREIEIAIAGEAAAVGPEAPGSEPANANANANATADVKPSSGSSLRTIGMLASGAVAVIGLGVGVGFYMKKQSAKDEAEGFRSDAEKQFGKNGCYDQPTARPCADLVDANDRAKTSGTISTIGFIGAGVGAAGYVAFMLMPKSKTSTALHPILDPHTAGIAASGRF